MVQSKLRTACKIPVREVTVSFGPSSDALGMKLGPGACVEAIMPGGLADSCGINVGSRIVSIDGVLPSTDCQNLLHLIKQARSLHRPIRISFARSD